MRNELNQKCKDLAAKAPPEKGSDPVEVEGDVVEGGDALDAGQAAVGHVKHETVVELDAHMTMTVDKTEGMHGAVITQGHMEADRTEDANVTAGAFEDIHVTAGVVEEHLDTLDLC